MLLIIASYMGYPWITSPDGPACMLRPGVLIAYIRPFLLNILLPQETTELSYAEQV